MDRQSRSKLHSSVDFIKQTNISAYLRRAAWKCSRTDCRAVEWNIRFGQVLLRAPDSDKRYQWQSHGLQHDSCRHQLWSARGQQRASVL
eukprot:5641739-Pyramimonas_sp.AAC.1